MPIYAYRCAACGHSRDVLQKISDPVLSVCPVCGADQFQKQVTAAGFQLKGSGWYATDFRNGSGGAPAAAAAAAAGGGSGASGDGASSTTPAAPAPAPASGGGESSGGVSAASAGGACGGGCACH